MFQSLTYIMLEGFCRTTKHRKGKVFRIVKRLTYLVIAAITTFWFTDFLFVPQVTAAPHSVVLTWTPSVDGGAVTVYRATGACSVSSVFASITTGIAANTYTDGTVGIGAFCYQVTTIVNGRESAPSNQITAVVLPSPPTSLTASPTAP